jgi:membrane protease YdiL (CAAX protease family)
VTIAFLAVLLAISFSGAGTQHRMTRSGRTSLYLITIGWEWLMTGTIFIAIRRHGRTIRELIGGRWKSVEDFLLDIAIAAMFWIVSAAVLVGVAYAMGMNRPENLERARNATGFLMPQSNLELALWPVLTLTAGFCEEVIFRGYLLKQFAALTRSAWLGMALSSIVFGLSHGYQGPKLMFVITVYGMMFAILAHLRRSTRPGMMAHAWQDTLAGLARHFLRM